jgi:protoporphyrinogen oxidase
MKNKVGIIGAGPAGLTAAYELSKNASFSCDLFEQSNEVGGMARSIILFDRILDIGPHRYFSNDLRVNMLWLEIIGDEYKMVDRTTRIFYKKKFYFYPLKPINALFNLGILESFLCVLSYFNSRFFKKYNLDTFEGWVSDRFGKRLYNTFFKSYTEKLWGISCDDLTSEFAKQRIKKFSLGEAIISSLKLNKNKHKTLVDQFAYPIKGNGYVYEKMKIKFVNNNGNLFFNSQIESIEYINKKYFIKIENKIYEYDYLISTMPIDNFLNIFKNTLPNLNDSISLLSFRNTIVVYVKVDKLDLFIDQWLYIQDSNILSGRITNFNNWIPDIICNDTNTVLALEYWCFDFDDIWNYEKSQLSEIATKDLLNCGFIDDKNQVLDFEVIKVPKCYPIYKENYNLHLDKITNFLSEFPGLQLIGRYGSFKYNNQDHSILMGLLAARNILYNEKNDTWSINTDYEYHESSKITATGLQKI